MTKVIAFIRGNAIAIAALFLALSGGYAIAATTNSNTFHGCVVKKTGELFVKSRCSKGQRKISWNQQGPRGKTGTTGAPGQAPPSAWAIVSNAGQAEPTDGITATHVSAGTYQLTVTASVCAGAQNAPLVSVSDGNPPNGQTAGAFPVAWVGDTGTNQFTVYTGVVVNGMFTPTDHTFNIEDVCN
jgi:hypothetical protein